MLENIETFHDIIFAQTKFETQQAIWCIGELLYRRSDYIQMKLTDGFEDINRDLRQICWNLTSQEGERDYE